MFLFLFFQKETYIHWYKWDQGHEILQEYMVTRQCTKGNLYFERVKIKRWTDEKDQKKVPPKLSCMQGYIRQKDITVKKVFRFKKKKKKTNGSREDILVWSSFGYKHSCTYLAVK